MIATTKMNKDSCGFSMEKNQQNCTIYEKMPLLTRLMKDVWLVSTLYVHQNGNVEMEMLKSALKTLIFSQEYISS